MFFINNIFYCAFLISISAFCESISFSLAGRNYFVSISDQAFKHISLGQRTADGFSGGHSWTYYYETHIKGDPEAKVFFDTNLGAYIVGSSKGDSLIDIIQKLQRRERPHYHSLFASEILNQKFILNSFKRAILLQEIKNEKHFDGNLFYVEHDGFKVAGYFEHTGDHYEIKTFFPDLCWYYRLELGASDAHFDISRFLKYVIDPNDSKKGVWVRNGVLESELTQDLKSEGYPTPIAAVSTLTSGKKLTPQLFLSFEQFENFLRAHYLTQNQNEFIEDPFNFMFNDPQNPTEAEYAALLGMLKFSLSQDLQSSYNFESKIKKTPKNTKLNTKIFILKRNFKEVLKEYNTLVVPLLSPKDIEKKIRTVNLPSKNFYHLFMKNLLSLYAATLCLESDQNIEGIEWDWRSASKRFYDNFVVRLLKGNNELLARLQRENLIFSIERGSMIIQEKKLSVSILTLNHVPDTQELYKEVKERIVRNILIFSEPQKLVDINFEDLLSYQ
ncbi:MAG: hypothetical protein KC505_07680 [Myxococcales bacterium]|nr:hypothetical protein [Myxococcales bacterium]USN50089.1 MAG: hypothetical protein H6731_07395 [Myxococcales bacterium]